MFDFRVKLVDFYQKTGKQKYIICQMVAGNDSRDHEIQPGLGRTDWRLSLTNNQ